MFRVFVSSFIALTIFLFFSTPASAAFSISGAPSTITDNEEITITISLNVSGSSGNNYYLRGALSHVDSSTSYFGFTKNNSGNWHSGSPTTDYYQITMDSSGTWSGTINFKPDLESSAYKGAGSYNLKVGRYTQAGSGPTWADNTLSVTLASSSTPTPSPTATPTPTPTSTASPTPTPTATATPTPTKSPTPKPTKSPSPTPTSSPQQLVLGTVDDSTPVPISTPESTEEPSFLSGTSPLAIGMITIGIGFLGAAGIAFVKGRGLKESGSFDTIDSSDANN